MFTTNRYGMIDKVSYIMQKKTHFQTDDTHSDVTELMDPWVHISWIDKLQAIWVDLVVLKVWFLYLFMNIHLNVIADLSKPMIFPGSGSLKMPKQPRMFVEGSIRTV